MITKNKIQEAAASYGRQSVLESVGSDGPWVDILSATEQKAFIAGATWMQEQDQWIRVVDRLPGDDTNTVAILFQQPFFGKMTIERGAAYYNPDTNKWYSELTGGRMITIEVHNVIAWQELPAIPKTIEP